MELGSSDHYEQRMDLTSSGNHLYFLCALLWGGFVCRKIETLNFAWTCVRPYAHRGMHVAIPSLSDILYLYLRCLDSLLTWKS